MMNMNPGLFFATLSFASLLAIAPAASAEQPASIEQFSVAVTGIEKPIIWSGTTNFQAGALPKSADVSIKPGQTADGRSELFVDAALMVIQTYTTGTGDAMQSLQVPEELRIRKACRIAVGEECVVEARGQVAARVLRTR